MTNFKRTTPMMMVLNEMMYYAAREIGVQHSNENVEQVIMDLYYSHDIELDQDEPVTHELMTAVASTVEEWKVNTKNNYPELCAMERD